MNTCKHTLSVFATLYLGVNSHCLAAQVALLEAQRSHVTKWNLVNDILSLIVISYKKSTMLYKRPPQCRPKPATICRWRCHFLADMQELAPWLPDMFTQGETRFHDIWVWNAFWMDIIYCTGPPNPIWGQYFCGWKEAAWTHWMQ